MIRWRYFLLIVLAMIAGLLFGAHDSIHQMWRAGFTGLIQTIRPISLPDYHLDKALGRTRALFTTSDHVGMPQLNVFLSEHLQRTLTSKLPENAKKWQKGYMVYPDGELRRIKLRHRGDNPVNWMGEKKSWRFKTRKKRLIDRTRTFNLIAPQAPDLITNHLAYWIGGRAGVLGPKSRLVEFILNGEYQGIFTEVEHLDESFLRKRNIMPVNIYKGEQYNSERIIYVNNYLFDNPYLWKKLSLFNSWPKSDRSDLSSFLQLLRNAETDNAAFDPLTKMARFEDWARFSAYSTLVQSWHNSSVHNQRIISDPWRGIIQPVLHDTVANYLSLENRVVVDGSSHALTDLYSRDPVFLLQKYRFLYDFLKAGILNSAVGYIEAQIPGMLSAYHRDSLPFELLHLNGIPNQIRNAGQLKALWSKLIANIRKTRVFLKAEMEKPPDVTWSQNSGTVGLVIGGTSAAASIRLVLAGGAPIPTKLAWDKNGDGSLSSDELSLPFTIKGRHLTLDATFLANRVLRCLNCVNANISGGLIVTVPTQFNLVADIPLKLDSLHAVNSLTGRETTFPLSKRVGITPGLRNRPVTKLAVKTTQVWSGKISIQKTRVVDSPVIIKAGTIIEIAPSKSLIFRRKVLIEGTPEAPIKVRRRNPDLPWGLIALQGRRADGSRISHLDARGGSGGMVNGIFYTGMLSIHDAADIRIQTLRLADNTKYDDLLHIIYGDNIVINGCKLENALSDAIDVDISQVSIRRCRITNSGNDAIDFMSSKATIEDSYLANSKDKGISVGEASAVLVFNSVLAGNQIGLEAKDGSRALVANVAFQGNTKQINAYKKNWRYAKGGAIQVDKSLFSGAENQIIADKHSRISLSDSGAALPLQIQGKNISTDSATMTVKGNNAGVKTYQPEISKRLAAEGLSGYPEQRGPVQ